MSYSQETIKKVLFGSTRQETNILELVKFVRISLTEIDKLLNTTEGSLRSHHKTLTRVRQTLKMLQKRQRAPAFVSEFLGETRISGVHVEKLMEQMRETKKFLKQLFEISIGPLGDKIMIDPRNNKRRDRMSKPKTGNEEHEEYFEDDTECKILDVEGDTECKILE